MSYLMKDTFSIVPFRKGLNIELFDKIKRHILAHKERFDMGRWVDDSPELDEVIDGTREASECGTAACIAGWACLLDANSLKKIRSLVVESSADGTYEYSAFEVIDTWAFSVGKRSLGLDQNEAYLVMLSPNWPIDFRFPFAQLPSTYNEVACDRIDYFIQTGY